MEMYQKEYRESIEEEFEKLDYSAWMYGQYMISAIQVALNPKKVKYPKHPYGIQQEKTQLPKELQSEIQARKFEEWASVFNKKFEQEYHDSV